MKYCLSAKCYAKILFHAAKYPDRAINGILIGTISKKDNCVQVQDTIPLFHLDLALAPMLEVALAQVEIYASSKGLAIVGYYHGNELLNDISLSDTATCIAKKIASNTDVCCLLIVINEKLHVKDEVALKMYTQVESGSHWKEQKDLSIEGGSQTLITLQRLIENGVHQKVVDFDCHLENISADWSNPDINKIVDN